MSHPQNDRIIDHIKDYNDVDMVRDFLDEQEKEEYLEWYRSVCEDRGLM